jgi:nitroimidazol reductase NimA-like FMN-containing flavoprotein (pyridoxamine 5'-phosphate oxidase superfamily)
MEKSARPVFGTLSPGDCEALLARNWICRLAFSLHDRVDIEPLHYAYDAPWIFGRTAASAKLLTLEHNRWCALEVDEVRDLFDWESVVVKGPFYMLNAEESPEQNFDRAVRAIRRVVPAALTERDPTPNRDVVFGVHASEIVGRSARSGSAAPSTGWK